MEAMTCGLPGVVSHVGDLSDLVTHGVNGFLVRERDPRAFAQRLAELLDDPLRYAAFADAARQAAARYESAETTRIWDAVLRDDYQEARG
jgi:glycosyltransferase involved in cell wall biosynthesis